MHIAGRPVKSVIDYTAPVGSRAPGSCSEAREAGTPGDGAGAFSPDAPPTATGGLAGQPTAALLQPADMLAFGLGGGDRVIVRPSGTEPKLKVYIETVEPVRDGALAAARRKAHDRLGRIAEAVRPLVTA